MASGVDNIRKSTTTTSQPAITEEKDGMNSFDNDRFVPHAIGTDEAAGIGEPEPEPAADPEPAPEAEKPASTPEGAPEPEPSAEPDAGNPEEEPHAEPEPATETETEKPQHEHLDIEGRSKLPAEVHEEPITSKTAPVMSNEGTHESDAPAGSGTVAEPEPVISEDALVIELDEEDEFDDVIELENGVVV